MYVLVNQQGYQYASIAAATLFLLPQIRVAYKLKSLKEISTISLIFILVGSILWTFYMYENQMRIYAILTLFVSLNSFILLFMQFYYYYLRINQHMLKFDKPPPLVNITSTPETNSV
uniref:PQ-loop repeat-containing protein n=1 Tax=viral metagenome TaxID=1070528 RepID=A0A6C0F671_9ZZZZ|tara:strand:+ start:3823 stop:4173 length:351 start_codon:yes stop_codon:yes gene_type:complete